MWQTKYDLAVPMNLGLGFDFQLCSGGDFLTVVVCDTKHEKMVGNSKQPSAAAKLP